MCSPKKTVNSSYVEANIDDLILHKTENEKVEEALKAIEKDVDNAVDEFKKMK